MGERRVIVRRGGGLVQRRDRRLHIVLCRELALHMAGAYPQLHHHGRVRGFRQLEGFFHAAHDGRQVGARVHQPEGRLHRIGVRALLDDAGAVAVILADDDQAAALHAGRGEIGERVGGDIGADDRLPRHRPARGIHDGGAEHGGGRGLVGAGDHVHAEFGHVVLGLHHDVEQMRDGGALIAADVGHAGLQQGLGDGQNALAVKDLALAELQALDFSGERALHGSSVDLRRTLACLRGRSSRHCERSEAIHPRIWPSARGWIASSLRSSQ